MNRQQESLPYVSVCMSTQYKRNVGTVFFSPLPCFFVGLSLVDSRTTERLWPGSKAKSKRLYKSALLPYALGQLNYYIIDVFIQQFWIYYLVTVCNLNYRNQKYLYFQIENVY